MSLSEIQQARSRAFAALEDPGVPKWNLDGYVLVTEALARDVQVLLERFTEANLHLRELQFAYDTSDPVVSQAVAGLVAVLQPEDGT